MTQTLSAGIVVVRRFGTSWRFLLLRAYRNWDFPKGQVEDAETPLQAALREVKEETGIDDVEFTWGRMYRQTDPYGRGKVACYYLGETHRDRIELPVNPELGRPEHHEWGWFTPYEVADRISERLQPILSWAVEMLDIQ